MRTIGLVFKNETKKDNKNGKVQEKDNGTKPDDEQLKDNKNGKVQE
ncbi:MAG: hypothetical protein SOZ06_03615 [Candidatus Faecenecus gallistercoris]|nr:hypothetical protein [Bacillota bacterium]MDY4051036.1 hypothetical protein [Candidatus Faecenecus gallistercoris]